MAMPIPNRKTPGLKWIALVLAAGAFFSVGVPAPATQEPQRQTEQTAKRIDRLIEQLGDKDYFIRQQAEAELAKLSFEAFDALSAATTHEDLEIAARARHLLRLMRVQWTTDDDPAEVKMLLRDYEVLSNADKVLRMRRLAALPKGAGIPALCRLVRYERPAVLSKQAAVELLSGPAAEVPDKALGELLRKHLGSSRRPGAIWLVSWLRLREDAQAAISQWTKLVDAEYSLLGQSSAETSPDIVAKLVRLQVQWLKRLQRSDEVVAAMHRLVDLETGNPQTLAELLRWLIEQQAWESVDKLAGRFPAQFARNPLLLYTVAQAQGEKGRKDQAEQTAQRALALNPGNDPRQLITHYQVAQALWERGMLGWAQREFRHVIDSTTSVNEFTMEASRLLGELLHDQGEELPAAEVLDALVQSAQKQPVLAPVIRTRLPAIRSRMNYFYACHFQGRNDRAKQRQYLDQATAADPTDVDVLIARYRLPDQTAEYREETLRLIKQAAEKFRREVAHSPDNVTPYNQFAWLVANTEGDLEAAREFSERSIQLSPDSGGFYDTLAHVYFAKGDYQNAVETQTRAAQMEPHSKLIARQLEVFRKKLSETKAGDRTPRKPGG
jgi:tetratricopeptide (TPR) repeat protein